MNRTMMRELYEHLLAEPVKDNQVADLIKKIESELDNFPIAYISRSDIQRAGYESSTLSDEAVRHGDAPYARNADNAYQYSPA